MYGNPYYQQPMQLVRVNGIEGARAYQMPANSTTALFDTNQDVMYIRTTDGAGFPQIRVFSFTQIREQQKDDSSIRNELDKIRAEVEEIKGVINNGKQFVRKQKDE